MLFIFSVSLFIFIQWIRHGLRSKRSLSPLVCLFGLFSCVVLALWILMLWLLYTDSHKIHIVVGYCTFLNYIKNLHVWLFFFFLVKLLPYLVRLSLLPPLYFCLCLSSIALSTLLFSSTLKHCVLTKEEEVLFALWSIFY